MSTPGMDDTAFLDHLTSTLAALPGVEAVALGGSRAQGTAGPESDWDLAIYYRDHFDPQHLRDVGWPGEVSEIGGWGGGVFNGGAWLTVEGRKVDVHYRDLTAIEQQTDRAQRGEFDVEPLLFHLAGIPTYLVVAEAAIARVLHGQVPRLAEYPDALRESASTRWAHVAEATLDYTSHHHAPQGKVTACLGALALAATQYAHAVAARRGLWVTNEKRLLQNTGLDEVDAVLTGASAHRLPLLVERVGTLARIALQQAPR